MDLDALFEGGDPWSGSVHPHLYSSLPCLYFCTPLHQGCHASGRPRPRPADVRTRPTIPRTSALAAVRRQTARLSADRLADGEAVRRPPGPSSKAVRRRRTAALSAGGRPQLPSTGSHPPPPSIRGRPPTPSALYDSNFSFLHYVFVSLIAVT
jgi:hypothetical protein